MSKKILLVVLAALAIIVIAGCTSQSGPPTSGFIGGGCG